MRYAPTGLGAESAESAACFYEPYRKAGAWHPLPPFQWIACGGVAGDGDAAVDGERSASVVLDAAALVGLATSDGDVLQCHRAIVTDTAAVVGPTAGEHAVVSGAGQR